MPTAGLFTSLRNCQNSRGLMRNRCSALQFSHPIRTPERAAFSPSERSASRQRWYTSLYGTSGVTRPATKRIASVPSSTAVSISRSTMRTAWARTLGSRAESGEAQCNPVDTLETTRPAFSTFRRSFPHFAIRGAHLKPRDVAQPQLDAIEPGLLDELQTLFESPLLRNHVVADGFLHRAPHPRRGRIIPQIGLASDPARILWRLDVCLRAVRETSGHAPARDSDRAALRVRVSVQHRSGRRAPRACHHLVRPPARRLDHHARRHGGHGARRRRGPSVVRAADRTAGATTLRVVPPLRNAERGTGGEDLA